MRGDGTWEARGSAPRKCQGRLLLAAVSSPANGAVVFGAPLALKLVLVSEEKVCNGWRWGSLAERKVWGQDWTGVRQPTAPHLLSLPEL